MKRTVIVIIAMLLAAATVYGINDVVHYQGRTLPELEQAFRDSVDAYLAMCEEDGAQPEKPYSGKLVARLGEDLHRQAASVAQAEGISLNDLVCRSLAQHLKTVHADLAEQNVSG